MREKGLGGWNIEEQGVMAHGSITPEVDITSVRDLPRPEAGMDDEASCTFLETVSQFLYSSKNLKLGVSADEYFASLSNDERAELYKIVYRVEVERVTESEVAEMSLNSLDLEQFEQNVWNFFSKRLKWAGAPVARLYSVEVPLLAAVSWSAGFQGRREVAVWITDQYEECWMHDNLKIGQFQMEQGQTVDCLCGFPSMIFPPDAKDISPVVGVLTLLTDGTGRGKVLLFEAEIRWDNNNRDFEQLCAGQDVLASVTCK
jgi:hypothetical protein